MKLKMNAAEYAMRFNNTDDNFNNDDDKTVDFDKLQAEGEKETVMANLNVKKRIRLSGLEEKYAIIFQKFLVYSTGISVGIILINLMYILLFDGADIIKVMANIFAAITLVAINERIK